MADRNLRSKSLEGGGLRGDGAGEDEITAENRAAEAERKLFTKKGQGTEDRQGSDSAPATPATQSEAVALLRAEWARERAGRARESRARDMQLEGLTEQLSLVVGALTHLQGVHPPLPPQARGGGGGYASSKLDAGVTSTADGGSVPLAPLHGSEFFEQGQPNLSHFPGRAPPEGSELRAALAAADTDMYGEVEIHSGTAVLYRELLGEDPAITLDMLSVLMRFTGDEIGKMKNSNKALAETRSICRGLKAGLEAVQRINTAKEPCDVDKFKTVGDGSEGDLHAAITLNPGKIPSRPSDLFNFFCGPSEKSALFEDRLRDFAEALLQVYSAFLLGPLVAGFVTTLESIAQKWRAFTRLSESFPHHADVKKTIGKAKYRFECFLRECFAYFRVCVMHGIPSGAGSKGFLPGPQSEVTRRFIVYLLATTTGLKEQMRGQEELEADASGDGASAAGSTRGSGTRVNGVLVTSSGLPVAEKAELHSALCGYTFSGDANHPHGDPTRKMRRAEGKKFTTIIRPKGALLRAEKDNTAAQNEYRSKFLALILSNKEYMAKHQGIETVEDFLKERYKNCLRGRYPDA